jgi:hypothetical protein
MKPPNEKGALLHAPTPKLKRRTTYCFLSLVQVRRGVIRRCVSCDSRVTNRNLCGNDGRSALSGELWCTRCADFARQLLLRFGNSAR